MILFYGEPTTWSSDFSAFGYSWFQFADSLSFANTSASGFIESTSNFFCAVCVVITEYCTITYTNYINILILFCNNDPKIKIEKIKKNRISLFIEQRDLQRNFFLMRFRLLFENVCRNRSSVPCRESMSKQSIRTQTVAFLSEKRDKIKRRIQVKRNPFCFLFSSAFD